MSNVHRLDVPRASPMEQHVEFLLAARKQAIELALLARSSGLEDMALGHEAHADKLLDDVLRIRGDRP